MGKLFQKLRRDFLTGLVVLIPIVLTVYLVWSVIAFIDKVIIPIIPPKYNPLELFEIYIPDNQSELMSGGRYDKLLIDLGSKSNLSAVGFATNNNNIIELI